MVTVIIIAGMSIWNEFGTALFLLNSPKRYTVSLTIYSFCSQKKSDWNLLFANITPDFPANHRNLLFPAKNISCPA